MAPRWTVAFFLASGCGPVVGSNGDDDPVDTDGPGSTTQAPECADYLDEPGDVFPRTIIVRNAMDEPLFLIGAAGCSDARVHVSGPVGSSPTGLCSCTAVMDEASCGICSTCLPLAMRLEPRASYTEIWTGELYTTTAVASECQPAEGCAASCAIARVPTHGQHFASLRATLAPAACQDDPRRCECNDADEGWCLLEIEAFDPSGEIEHGVEFVHPAREDIELVLQDLSPTSPR